MSRTSLGTKRVKLKRMNFHLHINPIPAVLHFQGPRSKFSSGGDKEEMREGNFGGGAGGGVLVDFYSISLK